MINVLIVDDDAMVAELIAAMSRNLRFSLLWNRFDAGKSERVYLQQ